MNNNQSTSTKNKEPLVSIVIGNYNYESFIKEAINSALEQTYKNVEIIVVDDGSTDSSREVIKTYGDKVVPVFKENGGQPSNYNAGFEKSTGEIICFLDSDDLFLPDKVERIVDVFRSSEDIGWCFHSIQLIDENKNQLSATTTKDYITRECDFRSILKKGKIPPSLPSNSALCFRRSILKDILPMPTTKAITGSDHYLKFMAVAISKGFILREALTLQKIHSSNMGTLRSDIQHIRVREYIFTAKWIRQEFPEFIKFSNKLIAVASGINLRTDSNNPLNEELLEEYLISCSTFERLEIRLRAIYYFLKTLIYS